MSLTYQPFAAVPEVNALGDELKHNIHEVERRGSVAAGAGILVGSMFGHGIGRLLLLGAAAALIHRGVTGHCHVYEKLGVSTREPQLGAEGEKHTPSPEHQAPPANQVPDPSMVAV